MYSVKPIGINTKDNDRDVQDGFLQESINMQWRDGAFKPMPERIVSEISAPGYSNIILHKVGDENRINVIGFNENASSAFLAFDVGGYLGGNALGGNVFTWFGTIIDGVYQTKTATQIPFVSTPGMSFTILNGLIYFMGNGSTPTEQYYVRLEFNDSTGEYKLYDMYAWKSLIPFYPLQGDIDLLMPKSTNNAFSQCGLVLIRFALVLKSGEIVLHSPIYGYLMYGLNRTTERFLKDDIIENIHTFINLDLSFLDSSLFESEVSAINVYASTADYETKFSEDYFPDVHTIAYFYKPTDIKNSFNKKAEEPFYLIKTIGKPTSTEKLLLTVGSFDSDILLPEGTEYSYSKVDISSIAAGEMMPVDNFSYHKLFGKITSYNGRLVIKRPTTILSGGHIRALAIAEIATNQAFSIITEDGTLDGISYFLDKGLEFSGTKTYARGILSYPDIRASLVGANNGLGNDIRMFKIRKNSLHNMSCNFDMFSVSESIISFADNPADTSKVKSTTNYCAYVVYDNSVISAGGDYISIVIPGENIGVLWYFDVPYPIDLSKQTNAYSPSRIYVLNVDYTVDNIAGSVGGRFHFNVNVLPLPPYDLTLTYYSATVISPIPETPTVAPTAIDANTKYSSENRLQFSEIGELKVWPAANSYRIGEGKVMNLGTGSVNPSESQIISPIIVGTTDGVYTINLDPNGTNFIASITKTANLPFLSEEILEIDQNILFVSDKGLMVFSDGKITNLTEAFFPQQGNGGYPEQETVYPNYDVLTQAFFTEGYNPYAFDDVVRYLKGALFAFDARRNNIWCSNPAYKFSLVYNLDVSQWGMSTMVFDRKFELYSIINTTQEGPLYTRYMVRSITNSKLLILSGEDLTKEVFYHVLTRPIKFQKTDDYKVLTRMFYRTMLQRKATETAGYFSIGLWGHQDVDRNKKAIPIVAKSDNRAEVYPGDIRYHIPVDCRKGKYKSITVLQSGKTLPESYISSFDFDIYAVDNTKMR